MNESLLIAHADDLEAERAAAADAFYAAKNDPSVDKNSPAFKALAKRHQDAMNNLASERIYWRQIGEAVELGAPGSRDPLRPLVIGNNDGSRPNYGGSIPTQADLDRDGITDWDGPIADTEESN